ncbi:MAG: hypothetical protein WBQ84_06130, partial [Methylocella sp.]
SSAGTRNGTSLVFGKRQPRPARPIDGRRERGEPAPGRDIGDAGRSYDALPVERAILSAGGTSRPLRNGHRRLPAGRLEVHNRPPRPVRARIEKILGT